MAAIPVEVIESDAPILFEAKMFAPNSAGAGRQRGGFGQRVVIRIPEWIDDLDGPVLAGVRGGRFGVPVYGLEGGGNVAEPTAELNGKRVALGGQIEMRPGDELVLLVPGGGGVGDPKLRPAEAVADDVRNGLIDPSEAERVYHIKPDKAFHGRR